MMSAVTRACLALPLKIRVSLRQASAVVARVGVGVEVGIALQ